MMVSYKTGNADRTLLGAVLILVLLGIIIVFSASSFRAVEKYGDPAQFLKLHLFKVGLGLVFLFWVSRMDYHRLRWMTPLMFIVVVGLLSGVLLMPRFHGTHRWMTLFGFRFQPSEFMKAVVVFYSAAVFANKKRMDALQGEGLSIHAVVLFLTAGLVFLEPDLGTAMVIVFLVFSMFFLAGVAWRSLAKMVSATVFLVSVGMVLFPYQRKRVVDFFGSVVGSVPPSYQVKQSFIGLARGGILGVGFAEGKQKLYFLPEPFSDFILASLGEELGFVGIVVVFGLLGIILWRGVRIALRAPDRYGYLLAGGITTMILISALVNAGVVVHLLPTTGLPFPFLSYGGSSLFVLLAVVGVLLNISRQGVPSYKDFTSERGRKDWWEE